MTRHLSVLALLTAALLLVGAPASAQTVDLTTPFPAVNAEAGEQVTLEVSVRSPVRQQVDLRVASAPEGWSTTLRGGGFVVSSVTTTPQAEQPVTVDLQVDVPDQASGTGEVVLAGEGLAGGSDRLSVSVNIVEQVRGAVTFETDFPRLQGGAQDTFTYDLTLRNSTGQEISFGLSAQSPEGWQVDVRPASEQRAATITVGAGSTGSVTVEATPPADVSAGTYDITVTANGAGRRARITLKAQITGSRSLTLTTPSEQLNASGVSGETTRVPLRVVNDGSAPLTDVSLSASPPTDWEVTFEPSSIRRLPAGQSQQVDALIDPANNAIVGDYMVTMTAETQGRSASTDIRFSVETSTTWGVVGVVLIAGAVGGLGWVFRRYGRG